MNSLKNFDVPSFTDEQESDINKLIRRYMANNEATVRIETRDQLSTGLVFPTRVTTLPATPYPGQEVYLVADAVNSVIWHLRYEATLSSAYKWEGIGGNVLRGIDTDTSTAVSNTTYPSSPLGPAVTVPRPGDYNVQWWFQGQHDTASGVGYMAVKNGSAAASDANSVRGQAGGANYDVLAPVGSQDITVTAAGTVLQCVYRTLAGVLTVNNASTLNPYIAVRPVRLG